MITKKSKYEISLLKKSGQIAATALQEMRVAVKPGVSTLFLDKIAEDVILKNGAVPTFKGYKGFPGTICSSVNQEVVHGIPSDKVILNEGDIISLDVGATYKGLVGDSAITVPVGNVSPEVELLLKTTEQALYAAIEKMILGNYLEDVSGAIEDCAIAKGLGIVRQYGGHGVGKSMHEDPFVFNYRTGDRGPKLKPGYVIALEPMSNLGGDDAHVIEDNWTVVTSDNSYSAHFEHTVLVTDGDPVILTKLEN